VIQAVAEDSQTVAVSAGTAERQPYASTTSSLEMNWLNDDTLFNFPIHPIEEWNLPLWDEASVSA
jgi:hypothetical protein